MGRSVPSAVRKIDTGAVCPLLSRPKAPSCQSCTERAGFTNQIGVSVRKYRHEIRDPIHVFVHVDSDEREALDSRPFQRLRHINQLGMTHLLYPGATHRRFEHSLGVMELASRVFDVITRDEKITDEIKDLLPELAGREKLPYWRRVLRMAALCHDLGHFPFSHAAEKKLLPPGWDHEKMTRKLICGTEMRAIWEDMRPRVCAEDLAKLAVGPKMAPDLKFKDWEIILAEIIVGDAFGVDRMDYLIRDSHHLGVAYGRFDHFRLIETLRILPTPPAGETETEQKRSRELSLGVEKGGLQSAEALLLARYFMYSQVYLHPIRRIYDIHLSDFLKEWLTEGQFPTELEGHLALTDNEVNAAISEAAKTPNRPGHCHARRILGHEHFKLLYEPSGEDLKINPEAGEAVYEAAAKEFGESVVRYDRYPEKGGVSEFPVFMKNGETVSSTSISQVLRSLPLATADYVFIERDLSDKAVHWLDEHKNIIEPQPEEDAL